MYSGGEWNGGYNDTKHGECKLNEPYCDMVYFCTVVYVY